MTDERFEDYLEDLLEGEADFDEAALTPEPETDRPQEEEGPRTARRNPFKFLDAYTPEDADIFFGRGIEIAELYREAFSHKVTVVFGNSGTGKTSLVQCGLFSRVKPEKASFYPIRSAIDPMASLKTDCIGKILAYDDGVDLFDNLARASRQLKKTLFLFFDQFEEIFILQPVETRRELAKLLKRIIQSDLDIKIIMGIREEYFARLIEFELVVPDILSNRIWVRNMSGAQAETVIVEPCRVCGVEIEPEVSRQVITELGQGKEGVELPYVQVVMDNLYRRATERNPQNPVIKTEDFRVQGGVKNILSNFIEDQIQGMPDVDAAKQVLKSLITAEGTKRVADVDGIAETAVNYGDEIEASSLREILRELVARRILREDPDNGLYELRHDALAHAIHQWMTGIEQELMEVRQTLYNRFKEYKARGTLLDTPTLKYIAPYENRLRLKPELGNFVKKSKAEAERKRKRMIAIVLSVVALYAIVFSLMGVYNRIKSIEATKQARIAERQKELAEKKAAEAEQNKKEAEKLLIEARNNIGLVFTEKADQSFENKNFNEARLYSYHALANLDKDISIEEISKTQGIIIGSPAYPILYSSHIGGRHLDNVNSLRFSPDGETLASGSWDNTIRLWDLETGKEKAALGGHTAGVLSVTFSPDGRTLASGSEDKTIRLWDLETGKEKTLLSRHSWPVTSVSFSPDGRTLASGSVDETIRLWDVNTGKEKAVLSRHSWPVTSVSFSPDGRTLASGSVFTTIRLWDVETGKEKALLSGHSGGVIRVGFSPDGETLASGSEDNTIRLWDVKTGKEKMVLSGHTASINSVSFSPDGRTLASGAKDKNIRLWDVETGKVKTVLSGHAWPVSSVSFSPDGRTLASESVDNTIQLWDVETGKKKAALSGHAGDVRSVSFSPDGRTLASGSEDNTIRLWDVETRKEKSVLSRHATDVLNIRFSPDGKTLASGSNDNTIRLYDVETGKEKTVLNGHTTGVLSVSFSPDGRILSSGSWDNTVRLVDVETGKEKTVLSGHRDYVLSVSFSPDGHTLASGSWDKTVRLWDVESGKEKAVLSGHAHAVWSVSFSLDGETLASGSWDNTIRLWDVETGKEKAVLGGHTAGVLSVSFSPDGRTLATGSKDKTIRLWDLETGKEKAVLSGHVAPVVSVSFSPDGRNLASGSEDKTIRLWDVSCLYDSGSLEKKIEEAEKMYNLQLVKLDLQPTTPETNLYGAKPRPPRWPKTHPFHWLSAAESGNPDAMVELGIIYDRDNELDKAWKWYTRALNAGSPRAKERIKVFKQWLTLHKDEHPEAYNKYCMNEALPN